MYNVASDVAKEVPFKAMLLKCPVPPVIEPLHVTLAHLRLPLEST